MSNEDGVNIQLEDISDPVDIPCVYIDGFRYPFYMESVQEKFDIFREKVKFVDGDVIFVSYPKSGNHWAHGYLGMLMTRSEELVRVEGGLMEFSCDAELIDSCPQPRIFATHMPYRHLPRDIIENKKIKIFVLIRNPKDTAVSFYQFMKMYLGHNNGITGDFSTFNKRWLDGDLISGSWFQHYRSYYESLVGKDNVFVIQYEKMKVDFVHNLRKIAEFLNIDVSDDFLRLIEEKTTLPRMKEWAAAEEAKDSHPMNMFFRRGIVGEWKEMMEEKTAKEIDELLAELKPTLQGFEDLEETI